MNRKIMVLTLFLGVLFVAGCGTNKRGRVITTDRMASGVISENKSESENTESNTEDTEIEKGGIRVESTIPEVSTERESSLYILQGVDTEKETVTLINSDTGKQRSYGYSVHTDFMDKYGDRKPVESFVPGFPINATIDADGGNIEEMSVSKDAWVYDDVVRYSILEEDKLMTIADSNYYFDDILTCYSTDEKITLKEIGKEDTLRVVGIDKRILSIAVTSGHGYLTLTNTELFDGSYICVGDAIFTEVSPDLTIEVPEGEHLVTVANDGWGSSKEVVVSRGEVVPLNLDEMKGEGPHFCKLSFDLGGLVTAKVEIDSEEIDYSNPVEVRYGPHMLTISAEGYDSISKKLVVNSEEATIELQLTSRNNTNKENTNTGSTSTNTGVPTGNTSTGGVSNNNGNTNNTAGTTTNNETTNENSSGNSNSNTNTNTDTNTDTNGTTDYLTTLYNLLTAVNASKADE